MAVTKDVHMTQLHFDLTGLDASISNNELRIAMPTLLLRCSLVHPDVMEDFEKAGFETREVENAADRMIEGLQALQLAKMLQKRRC